jgi:hypothetical protein
MKGKKYFVVAAILCAALATAGIAVAKAVKSGGVIGVSASFDATNVVKSVQKTCKVNGGDSYTYTRAVYSGNAVSADPRLNGAITIRAQSMVDDTTGIGALIGDYKIAAASGPGAYGRIEASLSSGQMSGAVRGHAPKPWGELFAGLNGSFSASGGFSGAGIGSGSGVSSGVLLQHGACVRTIYLH